MSGILIQRRRRPWDTEAEIPVVWPQPGDARIPQMLERWEGPVRTLTLDFRAPELGGDRVLAFEAVCAASSQQSWEAGTAPQETGLPSVRLPARCLVCALGLPPQCLLALQLGRAEHWHKKKKGLGFLLSLPL